MFSFALNGSYLLLRIPTFSFFFFLISSVSLENDALFEHEITTRRALADKEGKKRTSNHIEIPIERRDPELYSGNFFGTF